MDVRRDTVNLEIEMHKDAIVISHLGDESVAKQFYAALCNMRWRKIGHGPEDEQLIRRLKGDFDVWSCSWRGAGGIIAGIRNIHYNTNEDYMTFYCSGNEGDVSTLVEECFKRMGWVPLPWSDDFI